MLTIGRNVRLQTFAKVVDSFVQPPTPVATDYRPRTKFEWREDWRINSWKKV